MSSPIVIPNLLFEDIYTKEKFVSLKRGFLKKDKMLLKKADSFLVDLSKDDIVCSGTYIMTDQDNSDELKNWISIYLKFEYGDFKLNFYKDFLIPAINNIPDFYMFNINKIFKTNIFGKEAKEDFLKLRKDELLEIVDEIQDAGFLNEDIKELTIEKVFDCIEEIEKGLLKIERPVDKIPFVLNRKELIVLFFLFREKKLISSKISPIEYSKMLQEYFYCNIKDDLKSVYREFNYYDFNKVKTSKTYENIKAAKEELEKTKIILEEKIMKIFL